MKAEDFLRSKGYDSGEEPTEGIKELLCEFAKLHIEALKHLQQCKYYAGETGYIAEAEWENIINDIK